MPNKEQKTANYLGVKTSWLCLVYVVLYFDNFSFSKYIFLVLHILNEPIPKNIYPAKTGE
jgi:hypothetical protein